MNCIFCKQDSSNSKSIEHIIPESLGNENHILAKGLVCDSCNNYFSVKIEKPLLEQPYFQNLRFRNNIRTKRGNLVVDKALMYSKKYRKWVNVQVDEESIIINNEEDFKIITSEPQGSMIMVDFREPERENVLLSRFLAKAALEPLVYRNCDSIEWIIEVLNKKELDPLREYARYGKGQLWEYNQRRIYDEEDRFYDSIHHPEPYEILHEFDFLYIDEKYLFYILVIMGIEYVINLGETKIELYNNWLVQNEDVSPLKRYSEHKILRDK